MSHLQRLRSIAAMSAFVLMLAGSAIAQQAAPAVETPAATAPATAAPAPDAPAPQQATPPPPPPPVAPVAPAPQQATPAPAAKPDPQQEKAEALAVHYVMAAAVLICEIDISDDDDEKLQNAVDKSEIDAGLKETDRDLLWMQVVLDMQNDKAKACRELPADVIRMIRALK